MVPVVCLLLWMTVRPAPSAQPHLVYYSTLENVSAILKPEVGPAGRLDVDAPQFAPGWKGQGIIGLPRGESSAGGYSLPADALPWREGTVEFYLRLPEQFPGPLLPGTPGSMPWLLGFRDSPFSLRFDLREGQRVVFATVPGGMLRAPAEDWGAGQVHHVALTWDAAKGRAALFVDGVRAARCAYTPPTLERVYVNSCGFAQGNWCMVMDELKVWDMAKAEFDVPAETRARAAERFGFQTFGPPTGSTLFGKVWAANGSAGSEIDVHEAGGGVLALDVFAPAQATVELVPSQPIPLPEATRRVEAALGAVTLRPKALAWIVAGADGQRRELAAEPLAGGRWQPVMSVDLETLRYDGRRPVALVGLRLTLGEVRSGLCYLRAARLAEEDLRVLPRWQWYRGDPTCADPVGVGPPVLPLDWLLTQRGSFRVGLTVRTRFQGPPVAAVTREVEWREKDWELAWRECVSLPVHASGTYWVEARAWGQEGALFARHEWVLTMSRGIGSVRSMSARRPRLTTPRGAPAELLQLDTGQPHHAFPAHTRRVPLSVRVHRPDGKAENLRVRLRILADDAFFRVPHEPSVLHEHTQTLPAGAPFPYDFTVGFAPPDPGEVYDVRATLWRGDTTLDEAHLRFGVQSAEKTEPKSPAPLATLDTLAGPGRNLITESGWWLAAAREEDTVLTPLTLWRRTLEEYTRHGATAFRFPVHWGELEPLPGLFRWSRLDPYLDEAQQQGQNVILGLVLPLHQPSVVWLPREPVENEFGRTGTALDGRPREWASQYFPSRVSPAFRTAFRRFLRRLSEHTRAHPAVVGFEEVHDIFYVPRDDSDYSPSAETAFAAWSQRQRGQASRYRATLRFGRSLTLPLPRYVGGPPFDSPQARAAWDFRNDMVSQFYTQDCLGTLRAAGDPRPVGVYYSYGGLDEERYLRPLFAQGGYANTGYGDRPALSFYHVVRAHLLGGLWKTEYQSLINGAKVGEYDVDHLLAGSLTAGGAGMHLNFFYVPDFPGNDQPHGGGGIRRYQAGKERQAAWIPVMKELRDAELPLEVALYGPPWAETFAFETAVQCLYRLHQPLGLLKAGDHRELLARFKMVLVSDHLLPTASAKELAGYVRNGGKLVLLDPWAGRDNLDAAGRFPLLRALAWQDTGSLTLGSGTFRATLSDSQVFGAAAEVRLLGQPVGSVRLLAATVVAARGPDGSPAVARWKVGQGQVVLFLRPVDGSYYMTHAAPDYLADLLAWAGVRCDVAVEPPGHELLATHLRRGDLHYLTLYRDYPLKQHGIVYWTPNAMTSQPDGRPVPDPVSVRLRAFGLLAARYRVTALGPDGHEMGVMTRAELERGITVAADWAHLHVFRCEPAP